MRLLRVLTAAIGLAALLPKPSAAQGGRQFKDAWFWGVKGGGVLYSSASTENSLAPLVGAEWLITRDTQLAIGRFTLGGEQPYAPQFGLSGR